MWNIEYSDTHFKAVCKCQARPRARPADARPPRPPRRPPPAACLASRGFSGAGNVNLSLQAANRTLTHTHHHTQATYGVLSIRKYTSLNTFRKQCASATTTCSPSARRRSAGDDATTSPPPKRRPRRKSRG